MNRALPLVLLVGLVAVTAFLLWPSSEPAASSNPASVGGATVAPAADAGKLDQDPTTRETASSRLRVRVFRADGSAVDEGDVLARIDNEVVRTAIQGGVAEIPRAQELVGLAARSGERWSTWKEFAGPSLSALDEVRLELSQDAARLQLRVVYENGSAAEAPELLLSSNDPRADLSLPVDGWIRGAGGVLESGPLAPGFYSAEIRAASCVPLQEGWELRSGEVHEDTLRLDRAGSITGIVRGPDGPLENVVVVAIDSEVAERPFSGLDLFRTYGTMPPERDMRYTAASTADGSFRVDGVRPGNYVLLLHDPMLRPLVVEPGFDVQPLTVAEIGSHDLQQGNTVEVLVRAVDGAPQSGASVRWRTGAEGIIGRFTQLGDNSLQTGEDGKIVLHAIPEGLIAIEVEHETSAPVSDSVEFAPGPARTEKLELSLDPGAQLSGTVVRAADNSPIQRAQVRLFPAAGGGLTRMINAGGAVAEAYTDDVGHYHMDRFPAGEYLLEATHEEYAPTQTEPLEVEGEVRAEPIALGFGGTIEVHTQTESGAPRPNATVALSNTESGVNVAETTDEAGIHRFERLSPGTYQVALINNTEAFESNDTASLDIKMAFVVLEAGEEEIVKLGASGPTADVEGFVSRRGQPIENATVIVILPSGAKVAQTAADGGYRLEEVPVGDHILMLQLSAGGIGGGSHYEGLSIAAAGTVQHDIVLPGAALQVVVRDQADGGAIAGMPVSLRPADGSHISGADFGITDGEGKVSFDAVAPGLYQIAAGRQTLPVLAGEEMDRFAAKQVSVTIPDAAEHDQQIEISLEAGATFRARVSDRDGNYIPGASLFYLDRDGQPLSVLSMKGSNSKGVVQLVGLPPGPGQILVRHPDHGAKEISVSLIAGEVSKQEVTLDSGTSLYVEVVDANGAPIGGVLAVAVDSRGAPMSTMWSMEESQQVRTAYFSGTAQKLGPLPAGSYTVRLIRPGQPAVEHKVTLRGEAERRLRLSYEP